MSEIRLDSAVKVDWPDARWNDLHDQVGVVLGHCGSCKAPDGTRDRLWHVKVEGYEKVQIIGESHLRLLRPDLERYIHSTRFALTGSDVVHDSLRADGPRYTAH